MAGCVQHAIRLANVQQVDSDLMTLALSSTKTEDMAFAARHYEKEGRDNPAVMQKVGSGYERLCPVSALTPLCQCTTDTPLSVHGHPPVSALTRTPLCQ